MKKKMTVLGGLMMAVVLTGYSVAGTYAKYTDSASVSDNAYVAKWAIEVGATKDVNLFDAVGNNALLNNRVAPGGQGTSKFQLSITGEEETEVQYKVDKNLTIKNNAMLDLTDVSVNYAEAMKAYPTLFATVGGKTYYAPVQFTVNDGVNAATTTNTEAGLATALENADLTKEITISWAWEMEQTSYTTLFNYLDTLLGRQGGSSSDKYIEITASITAEQVTAETANKKAEPVTIGAATVEDILTLSADYSYDPEFTKGVRLVGNKLVGTIKANNDSNLVKNYRAEDPAGYYFPIVVTNTTGKPVTFGKLNPKTLDINGKEAILFALNKDAVDAEKYFNITVDGVTTKIDYSSLSFE